MAAFWTLRGRCALAAAALAVGVTAGGCGADDDFSLPDWDAPGQNARISDIMIRYAHVAEPRKPWQPGSDVPAYVWLYNKGGDFMKFTMRFENAGSITFNIQSQIPAYNETPSPTR